MNRQTTTMTTKKIGVFQLVAILMGGFLFVSHLQNEGQYLTAGYIRSLADTVDNHEEIVTTRTTSHAITTGRLGQEEEELEDDSSSIIEEQQDAKEARDRRQSNTDDGIEDIISEAGADAQNDEIHVQTAATDDKKQKRTTTNGSSTSSINDATSSTLTSTALPSTTSTARCKEMFMAGMEPLSSQSQDSTAWTENSCDSLFCDKIISPAAAAATKDKKQQDDDNDNDNEDNNHHQVCKWSHYAIDLLLENATSICTPDQIEEFYMDERWEEYRFSDYVRRRLPRKVHTLPAQFPNSLIDAVYKARNDNVEYPIAAAVAQQVANLPPQVKPQPNTLVIHLRLGDVLDGAVDPVRELLYEQKYYFRSCKNETMELCYKPWEIPYNKPYVSEWNLYVRPLSYYSSILTDLDPYTSVVIMGSAHMADYKRDATKSCHYTVALQAYLQRRITTMHATTTTTTTRTATTGRRTVELRLGRPPDDDIMFGAQVTNYIPAGGGFSNSVGKLNKQFKEIDAIRNILLKRTNS